MEISAELVSVSVSNMNGDVPSPLGSVTAGQRLYVTLRPEKLMIEALNDVGTVALNPKESAPLKPPFCLQGVICEIVYLGTDTRYIVELSSGEKVTIRIQNTGSVSNGISQTGQKVRITCSPEHIRLLME